MLSLYRILAIEQRNFGVADCMLEQSPSSDQDWERFEQLVDAICDVRIDCEKKETDPQDFGVSTSGLLQTDNWTREQLETVLYHSDGYFMGWTRAEANVQIAEVTEQVGGRQPRQFYYQMKSNMKIYLPWATTLEEVGRIKTIKYLCQEAELGELSLDRVPAAVAENVKGAFVLEEIPDVTLPVSSDGFVFSEFFDYLSGVEPNPRYQQEPF